MAPPTRDGKARQSAHLDVRDSGPMPAERETPPRDELQQRRDDHRQWSVATAAVSSMVSQRLVVVPAPARVESLTLAQAALNYVRHGIPVFPLIPKDKRPATAHGFNDATLDEVEVQRYWHVHPNANIGIPTGPVSGLVVPDIDAKHGATYDDLERLAPKGQKLTPTWTVRTPSGGLHLIYLYPYEGRVKTVAPDPRLCRGIDTRGEGGYIVAAPSVTEAGVYTCEGLEFEPAPLPAWLHDLIVEPDERDERDEPDEPGPETQTRQQRTSTGPIGDGAPNGGGAKEDGGRKWLEEAIRRASAEKGTRNQTGFWLVCQLRDAGLSMSEAEGLMRTYAHAVRDAGDAPYHVREAMQSLKQAYKDMPRERARSKTPREGAPRQRRRGSDQGAAGGATPPPESGLWQPTVTSLRDLREKDLPAVRWVVHDLLPEGVTLLAAKAKKGKSTLMLHVSAAVAAGTLALGHFETERCKVLYLDLEGNERRSQKRMRQMMTDEAVPDGVYLAYHWLPLDKGGDKALETFLGAHPAIHLLVIDTLEHIRPRRRSPNGGYGDDYASVRGLQQMAGRRQLAIVAISHLRKAPAEDPFDEINATMGLLASVDNALVMRPNADIMELHRRGRDYEDDTVLALKGDAKSLLWSVAGKAEEVIRSTERKAIIDVLKADAKMKRDANKPVDGMTPKAIALALGKNDVTIRRLLMKLLDEKMPAIRKDEDTDRYLSMEDAPPSPPPPEPEPTKGEPAITPEAGAVNEREAPSNQAPEDERSRRSRRSQDPSLTDYDPSRDPPHASPTVHGVNSVNAVNGRQRVNGHLCEETPQPEPHVPFWLSETSRCCICGVHMDDPSQPMHVQHERRRETP